MNPFGRPYGRGRACNLLSVADAAYIAGIIDGEGTIGLIYRHPTALRAFDCVTPQVAVNISAAVVLDWLADCTGLGRRSPVGYRERRRTRAEMFRWAATSNGAYTLVQQIAPYLKLKGANAAALIGLHESFLKEPLSRFDPLVTGQAKEHFHRLNAKGPGNWAVKARAGLRENFRGALELEN